MAKITLAILLAFLGYSVLTVGQAGQKIGLAKVKEGSLAGWIIWSLSTVATGLSFFLIFAAIILGSVSISGAMAGTGLVSLAVFNRFVLKEKLNPRSIIAILAIVASAAVIGIFDQPGETEIRVFWLYTLLGGGIIIYVIGIRVIHSGSLHGVIIGGLAGFLGAYSQLFQRYSTDTINLSEGFLPFILNVISNPISAIWFVLLLLSMVVLQLSYRHGKTIHILPVFTANTILVPVLGGAIIFGEALTIPQWIAIVIMVFGSLVLGHRGKVKNN